MIPQKLTLHNFLSYIDPPTLDFSQFDLAVISGDNGAGKSSILEALTWAVWEKTRAASSDDLIHQGTQNMWVDFIFEHEGETYRIFRRRDKKKQGGSNLEFQIQDRHKKSLLDEKSWQSLTEATLRATQEKIIDVLKIPYEIFTNSSYLRQGQADEFTVKTPAERKQVLGEILGLAEWAILEEKAKEKLKSIASETNLLEMQLAELKLKIADKKTIEKDLVRAVKEKETLQKTLAKLESEFKKIDLAKRQKDLIAEKCDNLRARYKEIAEEIEESKIDIKAKKTEKENLQSTLKNKEEINQQYENLKKIRVIISKLDEKQERYQSWKNELSRIEFKKDDLEAKISRLKNMKECPTCLRSMKEKEAVDIIKHLREEFENENIAPKKELELKIKKLAYDEKLHRDLKTKLQSLWEIEEQKRNLDIAAEKLKNIEQSQKNIGEQIKVKTGQLQKIGADGKILKEKLLKLTDVDDQWSKLNEKIDVSRHQLLARESNFGALSQALKEIESQEKKAAEVEKRTLKIGEEKGVFEELSVAFSKKGIQAMIIEQAIPMIEEEANRILAKASDSRLSLRFLTQRVKKTSEELIETLDIKITDEQGERDYEMYSGGEAFRINFSVRVALSKFLASRSGVHLKFLGVDEGFGTLDVAGREDLVEAINAIRPDFAKIIVITHIQEFKDLFPTQILVTKDNQGSHWEMVG